jgi:hypothetical protein
MTKDAPLKEGDWMRNPRKLAVLALGLSLGLAGFGPAAFAHRDRDEPDEPEAEVAESCTTSQTNDSDNSTGDSSQSGLININNIALQGLNLDVLGNLLCQGVFLNDIVGGVLGFAEGGDDDGDGEAADCSTSQDNGSDNSTGDSAQDGLVNLNNVALQGLNLDVLGNLLCGGNFLNDLTAGVLGTAIGGDDEGDGDGGASGCETEQSNDSTNETGDSLQGGLANVNNVALQGLNLDLLGNALCDGNFLNGLTAGILGTAIGGDDDGDGDASADCGTEQENESDNATGDSVMGGLLNLNNLALQGDNVAVLSNGLCGSIFLNDLLVSVLGLAIG